MTSQRVKVDSVRLFARIYCPCPDRKKCGKKCNKTFVFIPGLGENSLVFQCVQERLCDCGIGSVAFDVKGTGESDAPVPGDYSIATLASEIHQAVLDLGLCNVVLVGHSLGGQIALQYAIAYPEDLDRLVLVDTTPQLVSTQDFPFGATPEALAVLPLLFGPDFQAFAQAWSELLLNENCPGVDDLIRANVNIILQASQDALRETAAANLGFNIRDELGNVEVPTLVLHGTIDQVFPLGAANYLAETIQDAFVVYFNQKGHMPFLTAVSDFVEALTEFACCRRKRCDICPLVVPAAPRLALTEDRVSRFREALAAVQARK